VFGAVIVNVTPFEGPAPGFKTVTVAVPAVATREAGTSAVNWLLGPNVVASAAPFHWTTEPGTKP
jgi:hypothetical protein